MRGVEGHAKATLGEFRQYEEKAANNLSTVQDCLKSEERNELSESIDFTLKTTNRCLNKLIAKRRRRSMFGEIDSDDEEIPDSTDINPK